MPSFVKKFLVDAVETGLVTVFALELAFPESVEAAIGAVGVVGLATASAVLSAARRAIPGAVAWLREKLGVTE